MLLSPGDRLASYEIGEPLGAGGMGEVYRARDLKLGRDLAVKILPDELASDGDRLRRFEREARTASGLNHPNIVTIYDIGDVAGTRYIAMEWVSGKTLRAFMAPGLPLHRIARWGRQIAEALTVAHQAGIAHRDIKPDNVMVRGDGYVKLLDFGLACLIDRDAHEADRDERTLPGMLLGTAPYMSPEQARGETVTSATDIFSLGIVLFELATGAHPFGPGHWVKLLHGITEQAPRSPAALRPDLPEAFTSLLARMLSKQASARPPAAEVKKALEELERPSSTGR